MRIFLAGASGVIGVRLLPLLAADGHEVAAMTRSPEKSRSDLPDHPSEIGQFRARNDRMRSEGTRNLLAAAETAGAEKVIAQSIAWELPDQGAQNTVAQHEHAVLEQNGVVVRYGQLYGPDTFYVDQPPPQPRVNVDEAARLTLQTLDAEPRTILVVDEDGVREARPRH